MKENRKLGGGSSGGHGLKGGIEKSRVKHEKRSETKSGIGRLSTNKLIFNPRKKLEIEQKLNTNKSEVSTRLSGMKFMQNAKFKDSTSHGTVQQDKEKALSSSHGIRQSGDSVAFDMEMDSMDIFCEFPVNYARNVVVVEEKAEYDVVPSHGRRLFRVGGEKKEEMSLEQSAEQDADVDMKADKIVNENEVVSKDRFFRVPKQKDKTPKK
uniref:Uncharacterized protein n=1 Tax=Timspurckia oligopyrenoides TaxID=708627 RepID=A0A6T6NTC7_9RHOD|mmetsp:Transcript_7737/g.14046  ORF Transcript_7737/g.14046 Transcript_7737/m.14046 type:complete len:210 (+) Transcript_7737:47-676(+)